MREHLIRNIANLLRGIANDEASSLPLGPCFDQRQRPDDATVTNLRVVQNHCIHTDHGLNTDGRTVDHRPVSNVRPFFETHFVLGKHVQHSVLLHVAPSLQRDFPPVSSQYGARANVTVRPDGYVTDDHGHWMNVRRRVDNRHHVFKGLDHGSLSAACFPIPPHTPDRHRCTGSRGHSACSRAPAAWKRSTAGAHRSCPVGAPTQSLRLAG